MSDLGKVALQSLPFAGLTADEVQQLNERLHPGGHPVTFQPMAPEDALRAIALSTVTSRGVKLGTLQAWAAGPLADMVEVQSEVGVLLAAAVADPSILHPSEDEPFEHEQAPEPELDDDIRARAEEVLARVEAYAEQVRDLPEISPDAAEAFAAADYEASVELHDGLGTDGVVAFEEWEEPTPGCVSFRHGDAFCFHVYFTMPGGQGAYDDLLDPFNWVRCGDGFWKKIVKVDDRDDLLQEKVELSPVWTVWAMLRYERRQSGTEHCLDYSLVSSPQLQVNEGFLCTNSITPVAVEITMRKCVQWDDPDIQHLMEKTPGLCAFIRAALVDMANRCRIDAATVGADAA